MRRAYLTVYYQGKNITREINEDLLTFSFVENADEEADEIVLTLADPDRLWQGDWSPERGDIVHPMIFCESWFVPEDSLMLATGVFEVDEFELSSTTGGDVVTIKGVPSMVTTALAGQKKTRSWEGVSLSRIAKDIADGAKLDVVYRADAIALKRVDQRQETDLAFLQRLCTEQGCRLKIADGELVIFDGKQADDLEPVKITRSDGSSLRAKHVTAEVYAKVVIAFTDPGTGKKTQYEYTPPDAPATGKVLTLNQRVENAAQAERVAKAELRKKNAEEKQADFSGMGHPDIRAGGTVSLSGWGRYDGVYAVRQASHEISKSDGYTTSATLRKALEF